MSNDLTDNERGIMQAVIAALEEMPITDEAIAVDAIRQRARDMKKVAFRIAFKRLLDKRILQEANYADQPSVCVIAEGWKCIEKIYEEK